MSGVVNYTSTYTQSVTLADLEVTNADTDLKIKNTSDSSPENVTCKVRFRDTNDANAMTIGIDNNAVELKNECSNGTAKLSSGVKNLIIDESGSLSTFNTDLKSNSIKLAGSTSGTLSVVPAAATVDYTLNLPSAQGADSQTLLNDGSGNLSWGSASSTDLFNWDSHSGTIANVAKVSLVGDASFVTSGTDKFVSLTESSNETGQILYNHASTLPTTLNFEFTMQHGYLGGVYWGINLGGNVADLGANDSIPFDSGYSILVQHSSTNNTATAYVSVTNGSGGTTNIMTQTFSLLDSTDTLQFIVMKGRVTPSTVQFTILNHANQSQNFMCIRQTDQASAGFWNNCISINGITDGATYGYHRVHSARVWTD